MSIANNLKTARKLAGLSQHELSIKSGVPVRSVQWAESPDHEPSIPTLRKLAVALDLTMATLLGEGASPEACRIGAMAERLRPEDREMVVGVMQRLEMVA